MHRIASALAGFPALKKLVYGYRTYYGFDPDRLPRLPLDSEDPACETMRRIILAGLDHAGISLSSCVLREC